MLYINFRQATTITERTGNTQQYTKPKTTNSEHLNQTSQMTKKSQNVLHPPGQMNLGRNQQQFSISPGRAH